MNRRQRQRKLERARAHGPSVRAAKRERTEHMLGDMTKSDLIKYAERQGVYVAKRWTRDEILRAIRSETKAR